MSEDEAGDEHQILPLAESENCNGGIKCECEQCSIPNFQLDLNGMTAHWTTHRLVRITVAKRDIVFEYWNLRMKYCESVLSPSIKI